MQGRGTMAMFSHYQHRTTYKTKHPSSVWTSKIHRPIDDMLATSVAFFIYKAQSPPLSLGPWPKKGVQGGQERGYRVAKKGGPRKGVQGGQERVAKKGGTDELSDNAVKSTCLCTGSAACCLHRHHHHHRHRFPSLFRSIVLGNQTGHQQTVASSSSSSSSSSSTSSSLSQAYIRYIPPMEHPHHLCL